MPSIVFKLVAHVALIRQEMVGTHAQSHLARAFEIVGETAVSEVAAFRGFDLGETDHIFVGHLLPVDLPLIA